MIIISSYFLIKDIFEYQKSNKSNFKLIEQVTTEEKDRLRLARTRKNK